MSGTGDDRHAIGGQAPQVEVAREHTVEFANRGCARLIVARRGTVKRWSTRVVLNNFGQRFAKPLVATACVALTSVAKTRW